MAMKLISNNPDRLRWGEDKWTVKSSAGYVVRILGRAQAQYIEAAKTITIAIELASDTNESVVVMSPGAFERWDNDPPDTNMTTEQRQKIARNFERALSFMNLRLIVDRTGKAK